MRKYWLIFVIFFLGLFLRTYLINSYPLRFDQVQILENMDKIRSGKPTLIGPRTGPADMFTGPLVYYVAAMISFVAPYPYAAVGMAIFFYILTFIFLVMISRRYTGAQFSTIYLALFSFSSLIVILDRTPWNPNLSFLSGALVFFPLMKLFTERRTTRADEVLLALGVFLGYQAHFSGLLLPLLAILAWVVWSRRVRMLLLIILAMSFTFLPTIIFDYRYDWLNLRGLLAVLRDSEKASSFGALLESLSHDVNTVLFNQGRIFIFEIPILQQALLGLSIIFVYFVLIRRNRASVFPIIYSAIFLLAFAFYPGNKPEYYFLMLFPALVFVGSKVVEALLFSSNIRRVWLAVFFVFSLGGVIPEIKTFSGLTIGDQVKADKFVRKLMRDDFNREIVYDITTADQVGMKYLLRDVPSHEDSPKKLHLIFPSSDQTPVTKAFGNIAVWADPRVDSNMNYVQVKRLVIGTPKEIKLFANHYPEGEFVATEDEFEIFRQGDQLGSLYLFNNQVEKDFTLKAFLTYLDPQWDEQNSGWYIVKAYERDVWIQRVADKYLIIDLGISNLSKESQVELLSKITIATSSDLEE